MRVFGISRGKICQNLAKNPEIWAPDTEPPLLNRDFFDKGGGFSTPFSSDCRFVESEKYNLFPGRLKNVASDSEPQGELIIIPLETGTMPPLRLAYPSSEDSRTSI